MYLPAVETALSLVHDVHPRVGETVAVFGQGMIGYVTPVLTLNSTQFVKLTFLGVIDPGLLGMRG